MALNTPDVSSLSINPQSDFSRLFVPKNPDGTIFDCTSWNGALVWSFKPTNAIAQKVAPFTLTCSEGSHDATGVVITAVKADMKTAYEAALGLPCDYVITLENGGGTDTMVLAQATMSWQYNQATQASL
jgi:hypothetical protein